MSAGPSPTCSSSTRTAGASHVAKVPSTPSDPMEGVMAGVEAGGVELSDVSLFSHGTTVATNALITRRFEAAAMVTTRNFRDVLEIRRGTKDDLWDAYKDVTPAVHPAPGPVRGDRAHRLRRRGDDAARRGRGARARRTAQAARGEDGRGLLRELLREPGERDPDARDPRGGAAGRVRLHVQRDAARDLRVRALLDDRGQRGALPAGVRATSSASSSAWRTAGTRATC